MSMEKGSSVCRKCDNCAFVVKNKMYGNLECRRYPPTLATSNDGGILCRFPYTEKDFWCGEYKPLIKQNDCVGHQTEDYYS